MLHVTKLAVLYTAGLHTSSQYPRSSLLLRLIVAIVMGTANTQIISDQSQGDKLNTYYVGISYAAIFHADITYEVVLYRSPHDELSRCKHTHMLCRQHPKIWQVNSLKNRIVSTKE